MIRTSYPAAFRCVSLLFAIGVLWAVAVPTVLSAIDDGTTAPVLSGPNSFEVFSSAQWVYDDNVYRLPRVGVDFAELVSPTASREDHVESAELGLDGHWGFGRQSIDFAAEGNRSWYARNHNLNNTQGTASAVFNGQFGDRVSAEVGEIFSRSLANFAYTGVYVRDLVDSSEPFATGRIQVANGWIAFGGLRLGETTHSSDELESDDFRRRSGNVGLQYSISDENWIGGEYRYTEGNFRDAVSGVIDGVPFDRDYKEYTEKAILRYLLTSKLTLNASGGYLNRSYPSSAIGAFSGDIWRGSLTWQPTAKTQLIATGWRELRAYVEDESNYFVAKGVSVAPTWNPTIRISMAIILSYEDQHFVASDLSIAASTLRHDILRSQQVQITYTPRDFLSLTVGYQHNDRGSTFSQFEYGDDTVTINLTAKL
jgi:hypothetical protein